VFPLASELVAYVPLYSVALAVDSPHHEAVRTAQIVWFLIGVALLANACRRPGSQPADFLGLVRPRGRYVLVGSAAIVLQCVLVAVVVFSGFPASTVPHSRPTLLELALDQFTTVVIAPVYEELVQRGAMYRGLADTALGVGGAIVLTALTWALLHSHKTWSGMALIFVLGLALGFLRRYTGSTWVTIAVHAALNAIAAAAAIAGHLASAG
jgi:membrane protease YdiL (CAAX protease family)